MILYFDTFITDEPLHVNPPLAAFEAKIHNGTHSYKKQSKLDVVKYTLASYSVVKWSNVLIRHEMADSSKIEEMDRYIRALFPDAILMHKRSDNQPEYKRSAAILRDLGDEWIFYSPNNDHPMISSNPEIINKLIEKGNSLKESNNNMISIYYSHFSELLNSVRPGGVTYELEQAGSRVIDEDGSSISVLRERCDVTGIQILHRDLFEYWFCSHDLGSTRLIRSEDLKDRIRHIRQLTIVPKQEICRHYDAYYHTIFLPRRGIGYVLPEQVPPLFIPDGFFCDNIKIAYGYDYYRDGWVNINPKTSNYIFRDPSGTDMMCSIEDLPAFWKTRIREIDINPEANPMEMIAYRNEKIKILNNPWCVLKAALSQPVEVRSG